MMIQIQYLSISWNSEYPLVYSSILQIDDSEIKPFFIQFNDKDEWDMWNTRGDSVLHVELFKIWWLFIIAPLSANTLAKISNGIWDNLLTCLTRAWNPKKKPLLVAPSMNTEMYNHPLTEIQLNNIQSFGIIVIPSISKKLMCGDIGVGAMAEVETIWDSISEKLT